MSPLPTPEEIFHGLVQFWTESGIPAREAEWLALYQIATEDLFDTGPQYSEESKRAWS